MLFTRTKFLILVGLVGNNNRCAVALQPPPQKPLPRYLSPLAPDCHDTLSQDDYKKPITTVIQDHGGMDGFCLFSSLGDWAYNCYRARGNLLTYAHLMGAKYEEMEKKGSMQHPDEPLTLFYEKGTKKIRTHLRDGLINDLYCAANGWSTLKERVFAGNSSFMQKLADQECDEILAEHPEYKHLSMNDFLELNGRENDAVHSPEGPSVSDVRYHAAFMCLLGGLGCDMVNCAVNFCELDNERLYGHGESMCGTVNPADPSIPSS